MSARYDCRDPQSRMYGVEAAVTAASIPASRSAGFRQS